MLFPSLQSFKKENSFLGDLSFSTGYGTQSGVGASNSCLFTISPTNYRVFSVTLTPKAKILRTPT